VYDANTAVLEKVDDDNEGTGKVDEADSSLPPSNPNVDDEGTGKAH
jgi:hypothetical protein